jgi:hypothetical protein
MTVMNDQLHGTRLCIGRTVRAGQNRFQHLTQSLRIFSGGRQRSLRHCRARDTKNAFIAPTQLVLVPK